MTWFIKRIIKRGKHLMLTYIRGDIGFTFRQTPEDFDHRLRLNVFALGTKLAEALEHVKNNRLVFMDVIVDGTEHVYPMHIRGGGMDEMWLSKTERT